MTQSAQQERRVFNSNLSCRDYIDEILLPEVRSLFPDGTGHYQIYQHPNPEGKYFNRMIQKWYDSFHVSKLTEIGQAQLLEAIQAGVKFLSLQLIGREDIKSQDLSNTLTEAMKASEIIAMEIQGVENLVLPPVPELIELQKIVMELLSKQLITLKVSLLSPSITWGGEYINLRHLDLKPPKYGAGDKEPISKGFWESSFPNLETLNIRFPNLTEKVAENLGKFFGKTPELRRLSLDFTTIVNEEWDKASSHMVTRNPLGKLGEALQNAVKLLFLELREIYSAEVGASEFGVAMDAHPSLVFLKGVKHTVLTKFASFLKYNVGVMNQAKSLMSKLESKEEVSLADLEGLPDKPTDVVDIFGHKTNMFSVIPMYICDTRKPKTTHDRELVVKYVQECLDTSDRTVEMFKSDNNYCGNLDYTNKAYEIAGELTHAGDTPDHA